MAPTSRSAMEQPKAMSVALSGLNCASAADAMIQFLAVEVDLVLDAQQPQGADADGQQQHYAHEQRLKHRVDVEDDQQIADGAHDEGPEDRPDDAADAAEQRRAADDHRGDGVQRIIVADLNLRSA